MSRVERIGNATLYCGDALQVLAELPDNSLDAIVTDPPYCSGAATEAGKGSATHQGLRSESIRSGRFSWFAADNMTTGGLIWLLRSMAVEAARVVKETGSLCVFCDWRMALQLGPAMESAGWRLRNLIAWDKGSFGCGTGFRPQHELILHLSKRAPEFHSASVGNVLRCGRVGRDREHPTEKPVTLLREIVRVVSPTGGTVADPFMGSASCGEACIREGRKFIGADIDPAHVATAKKRLSQTPVDAPLFAGVAA